MRRRRPNVGKTQDNSFKYLLYLSGGVLLILVVTFIITFISYNKKLKDSQDSDSTLSLEEIVGLVPEEENLNTAQANTNIGQVIDEAINSIENNTVVTEGNSTVTNSTTNTTKNSTTNKTTSETNETVQTSSKPEEVKPKEPEFSKPVEGEIIREFAKDNLIFSETLQEWTRHLGIDIKAERTTVVKASEAGTVIAIKNDPRYGLTVVIEHTNGFKTIYSNLLTTEFVSEGETVEKGQSLGTVGNSAAFEIVDPPHLHFEILKDEINVDPNIYLK